MKKQYWKLTAALTALILIFTVCLSAVIYRAGACLPLMDDAAMLSGKLSFFNGSVNSSATEPTDEKPTEPSEKRPLAETPTSPAETAEKPQDTSHSGNMLPVKEIQVNNGNMSYDNITIRNTTAYDLDVESLLSSALPFTLEDNHSVQVLIYHTHTCER